LIDTSKFSIEEVLFQLKDISIRIEVSPKCLVNIRIIIFLSFQLFDVESKYRITDREALVVVRCLAKV
jgi:hypothetical protein